MDGLGGAADLQILHALKESKQLIGEWVVVEAGTFEGEQQLVSGFQSRKATWFWLLFDDVPARRRVREHDPG